MRSHRKPDLLFILTVFVGFGILVSSYIQYSRLNPTPSSVATPGIKQPVVLKSEQSNPLVFVSNPVDTEFRFQDDNGVAVNISPKQP